MADGKPKHRPESASRFSITDLRKIAYFDAVVKQRSGSIGG
jgi:hypothetical protein